MTLSKQTPDTVTACAATKAGGGACSSPPILGTDLCLAHSPEEIRESLGFGGAQPGAGRPPKPRMADVMQLEVEERVAEVMAVPFAALAASRTVWVGESSVEVPDHTVRLAAFRDIRDTVYGKPRQTTEISGPEGGPIEVVEVPTSAERATELAKILKSAGAA